MAIVSPLAIEGGGEWNEDGGSRHPLQELSRTGPL